MAEETIKIKEEIMPEPVPAVFAPESDSEVRPVRYNLNRLLYPINTPLIGRGIKNRDLFTLSGTTTVDATPVTVSTALYGATETNLKTFRIFSNEFHAGMTLRIYVAGVFEADATRTVTVKFGIGTAPTTGWATMNSNVGDAGEVPWHMNITAIVTSIGTTGAFEVQHQGAMNFRVEDGANTSTIAVNTTATQTYALTAKWSANFAGNSLTVRQFIIEILN